MAGIQVEIMANCVDKQRLGYQAISLTHLADLLEPKITLGSKVELGGALYEFTADESITGGAGISNSSAVYIKLTVVLAAITASFTVTPPTWDTAKQGWYSGSERYIGGLYKDGTGQYTKKWLYRQSSGGVQTIKEYGDETLEIIGIENLTVTGAITADGGMKIGSLGPTLLTKMHTGLCDGTHNYAYFAHGLTKSKIRGAIGWMGDIGGQYGVTSVVWWNNPDYFILYFNTTPPLNTLYWVIIFYEP